MCPLRCSYLNGRTLHFQLRRDTSRITVFIGPNNSGKSSVLQALLALRQAAAKRDNRLLVSARRSATSDAQPYLYDAAHFVDLGEFEEVARRGEKVIRLGVAGRLPSSGPLGPNLPADVNFAIDVRENQLSYHRGEIRGPSVNLTWDWSSASMGNPRHHEILRENNSLKFRGSGNFR